MMYTLILVLSLAVILFWIAMVVYLVREAKRSRQETQHEKGNDGLDL